MAEIRFEGGWKRFFTHWFRACMPALGFTDILAFLLAVPIIFYALLLAGCSSASSILPHIYIMSLSYVSSAPQNDTGRANIALPGLLRNVSGKADLEVRSGFFGLCVSAPEATIQRQARWLCEGDAAALSKAYGPSQDPLNLIFFSAKFTSEIVFYGLILAAMILATVSAMVMLSFPRWQVESDDTGSDREIKPFPSRAASQFVLGMLFFAILFGLVSILWLHVAAVAVAGSLTTVFDGAVSSQLGAAGLTLGWLAWAFLVVSGLGMLVMILSIQLLDRLTDDE